MLPAMTLDPTRTAVLALHWQVNVIEPHGFFGGMLAAPVAASGVVGRASAFHDAVRRLGVGVFFTRFTIPEGEGALVRNTGFMTAVAGAQESFRPDAPGAALVEAMTVGEGDMVVDNQRLSGLAATPLPDKLTERGIDATPITVMGNPARSICVAAERDGYDTIVVGRRNMGDRGLMLLGSVAARVVSGAACDVVVVA